MELKQDQVNKKVLKWVQLLIVPYGIETGITQEGQGLL